VTSETTSTGPRLAPLRPIVRSPRTESQPSKPPSTFRLSKPETIGRRSRRTLDFDLETVAAGFADPEWVPQRVVCWAYSWVGDDHVYSDALPVACFYDKDARRRFLLPLLAVIESADVLTGHNIARFDLPVLLAETRNLLLPPLEPMLVQDTIRLGRTKGFKKGQDNLGTTLHVKEPKMPLHWAAWENAYGEPDMKTVRERCVSDVRMHKTIREQMRARGWLQAPRMWKP